MRTILLGGIITSALCCIDQGGMCQSTFQRQYGGAETESVSQIALASDGGFLIAGSTRSYGSGETDAYLIRVDPSGDTLWTRVLGGVGWDMANSVLAGEDDNWLVAGTTSSFGTGQWEAFLLKMDDTGALLWTRTYAMLGGGTAHWLERTSDGGLIMTGQAGSGGPGMYLVRMTADGDTLWTRKTKLVGGSLVSMDGQSVVENSNGELLVFGEANNISVCYYYMDQAGAPINTGTFQGLQNYVDRLHVINVSTGGYLVTGTTALGSEALEAFAMRLNADLVPVWTKRYGGSQSERVTCVLETPDGGFAILGRTYSFGPIENDSADVFLLKIDPLGDLDWSRTYGGGLDEGGDYMVQTPDGGFCIAGTVLGSDGNRDIILFTVDADGHGGCSEATPATVTNNVNSSGAWITWQQVTGSLLAEPQLQIDNGAIISDPCNASITVPELTASAVDWQLVGTDIMLSGSNSNGLITVLDATGRILGQERAQEGTTVVPTFESAAGAYMATYVDGVQWSTYRFIRP